MFEKSVVLTSESLKINPELLSELRESDINSLRINVSNLSDLDICIDLKQQSSFYIEYTMLCEPKNILVPPNFQNVDCELIQYSDENELRKDALRTSEESFNSVWESCVPRNFLSTMDEYLVKAITTNLSFKLIQEHDLKAMFCLLPKKYFQLIDEPVETLGWIWIDAKISNELRMYIHRLILNFLAKRENVIGLSVYFKNSRSINFHKKYGFEVKCVRYTRY